ncbi:MAG: hypothetical protein U5K79_23540 [Cyclobacteriaceae bacterium]|nr:hypothetical protein [Cyclobacteriaceae bacterium]
MDKNTKSSGWVLSIIIIFLLFSCKVTYTVRNQQQTLAEIVAIPCGSIKSELVGRGNSKFVFRQKIIVDSPIVLFADSIRILFNQQSVRYTKTNLGKNDSGVLKLLHGKYDMEWFFNLPEGVFDGDTIRIVQRSYIDCASELHSQSDLIYTFRNPVRIQGVNEF